MLNYCHRLLEKSALKTDTNLCSLHTYNPHNDKSAFYHNLSNTPLYTVNTNLPDYLK